MSKQSFYRLFSLLLALFFISACGYRFAGSSDNKLVSGQSLWVSFIKVEIDSPSVQTALRRAILEECHAMRGLYPAGTESAADLKMKGNLLSYTIGAVAFSSQDHVKQFRLTIGVELELYRKGETTPIWKGTVQAFQDYPANDNLAFQRSSEAAAVVSVSQILARKFLLALEQAY